MSSISGLGSGLDINTLVDQLIALEASQQNKLKTRVTGYQSTATQYQTLNSQFSSIKSTAQALNIGSSWKLNKATSSADSVTASADSSALSGSLSFTVNKLASNHALASFGTVASTDTVIGTGSLLIGKTGALGFAGLSGSLSTGAHTIAVTQASAGAKVTGTPLANSITLTGSETIQANVDGVAKTYTLTAGTYTQQQLASMITQVSGGDLSASVNANKSLSLATTHEGSAATLAITGGTGLGTLGLTTSGTVTGTNGIVTVDGTSTTVTDIKPNGGNTFALNGGVTATFSGGLRVGSQTVNSIDLGDGKLSTVVTNINAASLGINAAAVQVAPNQYKLQLQSTATGTAGAISLDLNKFAGAFGSMETVTAAEDATLQVGSGASAYTISSSSNTVTGVLPGVTLNLKSADPTKTVTVSVNGDADGLADKVKSMLDAANQALSYIKSNSKYDPSLKTAGALLGNSTATSLQQKVFSAISNSVAGNSIGAASSVGIKLAEDGTFTFDKAKFVSAYQANPEGVAGLFVEGGTTGTTTLTNPGIAERLASVAQLATDSVSGMITTALKGTSKTIEDLNKQISNWDDRLAKKKEQLKAQFIAMDTAIARFKSTGDWLTNQISGLSSLKK